MPMQGVVQHSTINNLSFGRNPDETLRVLQALQYVQENPDEVGVPTFFFISSCIAHLSKACMQPTLVLANLELSLRVDSHAKHQTPNK